MQVLVTVQKLEEYTDQPYEYLRVNSFIIDFFPNLHFFTWTDLWNFTQH